MSEGSSFKTLIGVAAVDKELDSRFLKVRIPETQPMNRNAQATSQSIDVKSGSTDGTQTGTLTAVNFIEAEYIGETNKPFPPDVRKGEQILLYMYGDTNKYYWRAMGTDDGLRRTERVRLQANATLANNAELDDTNTYGFEIDTRTAKFLRLWTSKANGEKYAYTLRFDGEEGNLIIGDDADNVITLESEEKRITITNGDKSSFQIDKRNITLYCEGQLNVVAKEGINMQTNEQYSITSGNDYSVTTNARCTITSASSMSLTSQADTTITAVGAMTLSAGGGMSLSFGAGGTINGGGGELHTQNLQMFVD